jgi:hypothetical protein
MGWGKVNATFNPYLVGLTPARLTIKIKHLAMYRLSAFFLYYPIDTLCTKKVVGGRWHD